VRFHSQSVVFAFALALGAASLAGGCSGTGADTPAGRGGAAGTPTAGVSGSTGGASAAGSGGIVGTTGGGGQAAGGGGSGGAANPTGGTAAGGDAGRGGNGSGGQGGTAGAGGGGGSGNTTYNPCPTDGTPCKILPFGDSITRGAKSSDDAGYRSALFKLIVAAKQKVTFTGSLSNGPSQVSGQSFPRMHEGRPGWTIDPGYNMLSSSYGGIASLVPSPALNGNPNIILLMIGTNDLFARDAANMATRLEVLLDKIAQNAPNALIVLAQITPLGHSDPNLTAYNAKIPGIVQSHAAKGQHIIGVDMSKLPTSDLADGTHPTDQGYAYMANIWYAAIKDLLTDGVE
jgi:lysophospholipase L1-like esterase